MSNLASIGNRIDTLWEPLGDAAAYRLVVGPEAVGRNDDARFEVGSCFKAFVVAECCRQVAGDLLAWDQPLAIDAVHRVPSSDRSEGWPDGSMVTLDEAASAMIAVSDNTATDLVLDLIGRDLIGRDRVVALLGELGLGEITMPASVRAVYAQPEHVRPIASVATMTELTAFYAIVLGPNSSLKQQAQADFRRLLRLEDREQGTTWPDGVVCYRKSGSLEPPPMFAMAMAGAFETASGPAQFAFAINIEEPDEAVGATASEFVEGVTLGMRALSGAGSRC